MSTLRFTLIGLALTSATAGSWAQTAAEHNQHHPNAAASAPRPAGKASAARVPGAEKAAAMDRQMQTMREMHEKMVNARTPEERQALMSAHMKTMQEGMAMMNDMMKGGAGMPGMGGMQGGGSMPRDMGQRHQMMEKRMDMMQSMMQMMLDRMATMPSK